MPRSIAAMLTVNVLIFAMVPGVMAPAYATIGAYGCVRPEPPYIPQSDAEIVENADIISFSFEQYYSALSLYFRCIDVERQAILEQAKVIGQLHQEFYDRAERLGVKERAALPDREASHPLADESQR